MLDGFASILSAREIDGLICHLQAAKQQGSWLFHERGKTYAVSYETLYAPNAENTTLMKTERDVPAMYQ